MMMLRTLLSCFRPQTNVIDVLPQMPKTMNANTYETEDEPFKLTAPATTTAKDAKIEMKKEKKASRFRRFIARLKRRGVPDVVLPIAPVEGIATTNVKELTPEEKLLFKQKEVDRIYEEVLVWFETLSPEDACTAPLPPNFLQAVKDYKECLMKYDPELSTKSAPLHSAMAVAEQGEAEISDNVISSDPRGHPPDKDSEQLPSSPSITEEGDGTI